MKTQNPEITILPELKELIRPLSQKEFEQLKDNILAEGIRDKLILWKRGEEHILIDGHNRFAISQAYGLDFLYVEREFENIEQVKSWMIDNQLGKRNLTENEISYLRGLQYRQMKNTHGGDRKTEDSKAHNELLNENGIDSFKNIKPNTTASKLAEQHKVSENTIKRDEEYADAIDKISVNNPDLRYRILNKDINISKTELKEIAKLPTEKIKEVAEGLQEGKTVSDYFGKKPSKDSHFVNFLKEKETAKQTETPKLPEIAENSELPKKTWEIGRYKSKDEYGTYYMSVGRDQEKNEFHALYIVDEGNYKYTIRELKESEMPNAAHYEQIPGQEFNRVHEIASTKLCKNVDKEVEGLIFKIEELKTALELKKYLPSEKKFTEEDFKNKELQKEFFGLYSEIPVSFQKDYVAIPRSQYKYFRGFISFVCQKRREEVEEVKKNYDDFQRQIEDLKASLQVKESSQKIQDNAYTDFKSTRPKYFVHNLRALSCKNKLQEKLNKTLRSYSSILITNKEKFIDELKSKVEEANKEFPRCKPEQVTSNDCGWDKSKDEGFGVQIGETFDFSVSIINYAE